jgi:hypothetical protein
VTVLSKNPEALRAARHRSEMQRACRRAIANRLKHDAAQAGFDPNLCIVSMQLLHQGLLTEQQVNAGEISQVLRRVRLLNRHAAAIRGEPAPVRVAFRPRTRR